MSTYRPAYKSIWEPEEAVSRGGTVVRINKEMAQAGIDAFDRFTDAGVSSEGVARLAFRAMIECMDDAR